MNNKKILTIQDISCYGQCSITVALPILSAFGFETAILPSAILSTHTSGFKNFTVHDLSDEIPFMFISTKSLKEKAKYKKALGDNETIGWTLCHKEAIGFNNKDKIEEINIETIKQHFFKYANPKNMFLLPREIGFLGELKEFIEEQKD